MINECGVWIDGAVPRTDAECIAELIAEWEACPASKTLEWAAAEFPEYANLPLVSRMGVYSRIRARVDAHERDGEQEAVTDILDSLTDAIAEDTEDGYIAGWHPEEPGTFIVYSETDEIAEV